MNINILGISGSPRGGESRSDELLRKLLKQAKSFGGQTELLRLSQQKIRPCEGCCSKRVELCKFPCIHMEDGTNALVKKVVEADALAIATPVHWGGPSSLLKIFLDKLTCVEGEIWPETGKNALLGKPFILIASQDGDGAAMALSQINWALNHMGMFCLPWGMIFEPSLLKRPIVRIGLRLIRERKFEWISNTIRLAARNLVLLTQALKEKNFEFDDYRVKEPHC